MRILKLPKNTPIGTLIYRLKASTTHEKPVKFLTANGTNLNLIQIKPVDFYQANVFLNKPLQENEYNFTLYVTDEVEKTLVNCQIIVHDANQLMTSSFIHFRPLLSVSESASYNSTIGYIHVKERENSNLPVTFEIKGSDCFGIRYIFGPKGTSKAEIYLKTLLDYERQNLFRLQVYALNAWTNETFDTRNIVMKELIVTVINEQDTPPKFYQLPHLVQLTELTTPGDVVLNLVARDGDHEQDRRINYYLRQDDELKNFFMVDANTGEVVIKSKLDELRDIVGTENLFTLTFVAKEIENELKENVEHLDEISAFEHGFLDELDSINSLNMHNRYLINEHFYDDDTDSSSNLVDAIAPTIYNNLSVLNSTKPANSSDSSNSPKPIHTNDHLIQNNSISLKLNNNYSLQNNLKATHHEFTRGRRETFSNLNANKSGKLWKRASNLTNTESEINVGFIILYLSNHAPEFIEFKCFNCNQTNTIENAENLNLLLNGRIEENAKMNTLVTLDKKLFIFDIDHGLNGTFDLQLIDTTQTFDIIPKSGYRNQTFEILLINPSNLDYEKLGPSKNFNFKIIVTDRSPSKELRNELNCLIQVLDTNDNVPQFVEDVYYFNLSENEKLNTVIGRVTALDLDSNEFGLITYYKLSGKISNNFLLNNSTGELILISLNNIDQESNEIHNLVVYVCDNLCRENDTNKNQTIIEIKVLDSNDNKPEFVMKRYDFLLNSDLLTFSSPAQVTAIDLDEKSSPNSNLTYEIISGNLQNKFKIDEQTGNIEIINQLQIEGSYTLPVINLEANLRENLDENIRNHLSDYSWIEDNFDILHLDSLFSFYSPIINLTVRVHDQGIPIQENFVNVYIHSQNHINRTVVFLLNESENFIQKRKNEYERYLSEMTTGRVYIRSIVELNQSITNMNRTLIYCTITYPSQSVINVHKVNWVSSKLVNGNLANMPLNSPSSTWTWYTHNFTTESLNRQGRNNLDVYSIRTASLRERNILTWVLLLVILITILFLLVLFAVWFFFCCCKRKNKINSSDSTLYLNQKQHLNQRFFTQPPSDTVHIQTGANFNPNNSFYIDNDYKTNNKLLQSKRPTSASSDIHHQRHKLNHNQETNFKNSSYDDYPLNEFDATVFSTRLKKSIESNDNIGFVSEVDGSDETGVFASGKKFVKQSVDYLRSNTNHHMEDAYSILSKAWFGNHKNEEIEQNQPKLNDVQIIDKKIDNNLNSQVAKRNKVKFTDETVSLKEQAHINLEKTNSDEMLKNEHKEISSLLDTTKPKTSSIQSILNSQAKNLNQLNENQTINLDTNSNVKQPGSILKTTSSTTSNDKQISVSSDNDSGIEHPANLPLKVSLSTPSLQNTTPKLHLKNEDVTQKKSVFTIAYNSVRTGRLNSADSNTIYI